MLRYFSHLQHDRNVFSSPTKYMCFFSFVPSCCKGASLMNYLFFCPVQFWWTADNVTPGTTCILTRKFLQMSWTRKENAPPDCVVSPYNVTTKLSSKEEGDETFWSGQSWILLRTLVIYQWCWHFHCISVEWLHLIVAELVFFFTWLHYRFRCCSPLRASYFALLTGHWVSLNLLFVHFVHCSLLIIDTHCKTCFRLPYQSMFFSFLLLFNMKFLKRINRRLNDVFGSVSGKWAFFFFIFGSFLIFQVTFPNCFAYFPCSVWYLQKIFTTVELQQFWHTLFTSSLPPSFSHPFSWFSNLPVEPLFIFFFLFPLLTSVFPLAGVSQCLLRQLKEALE